MKIVYCIHSLHHSGGMERVLTTKVNYLADHYGHEVHIALRKSEGNPFFTLSSSVICHDLQANSNSEHQKKLTSLLMLLRPHITISMYGSEFKFLYKIKDGSKKIVEFHFTKYYLSHLVNGIEHLPFRFLHQLKAWLLQKKEEKYTTYYDKVVLLTQADSELWGNKPNMCYIHNPLSFRSEEVSPLLNTRIIAVGRYIAQKGFGLLIDAFSTIAIDFPEWELVIYGEGQDKKLLEHRIKHYHLEKQVLLYPAEKNIQKKIIESSIFAFPSIYEGFGLVLTEAMECGLPCIAFDCECGPKEIIIPNISGFLVENKNLEELASRMKLLMSDLQLRKKMGSMGKEQVSQFYIEQIMRRWNQLFVELNS